MRWTRPNCSHQIKASHCRLREEEIIANIGPRVQRSARRLAITVAVSSALAATMLFALAGSVWPRANAIRSRRLSALSQAYAGSPCPASSLTGVRREPMWRSATGLHARVRKSSY